MNLDNIDSPIDLILQNEVEPTVDEIVDHVLQEDETDKSPVDTVCDIVFNEHPDVGYDVIERILNGLINLHQNVLQDKVNEGEVNDVVIWTKDLNNLRHMMNILNQITRWHCDRLLRPLDSGVVMGYDTYVPKGDPND